MLEAFAPDVWLVRYDFFSMGLHFPGRMTVIRLKSGGLWLHSPVPIDDALAAELAKLGPVEHIVAPNRFHHMHVPKVKQRYPDARLYGAPGLAKKRADIAFDARLSEADSAVWAQEVEPLVFGGAPGLGEVVFHHKASKTVITTDLFMNVSSCQGWFSRLVYRLEGCYGRIAVPRLIKLVIRDKKAAQQSVLRMLEWAPERLVLAHGDVVSEGATEVLRAGFLWLGKEALQLATKTS